MEFDRGVESVRFFVRTKIAHYRRGLAGFPLAGILVIADRKARAVSLARSIPNERGQFLFAILDDVRTRGFSAPVFYRRMDADPVPLLSKSLLEVSVVKRVFCREAATNQRVSVRFASALLGRKEVQYALALLSEEANGGERQVTTKQKHATHTSNRQLHQPGKRGTGNIRQSR